MALAIFISVLIGAALGLIVTYLIVAAHEADKEIKNNLK